MREHRPRVLRLARLTMGWWNSHHGAGRSVVQVHHGRQHAGRHGGRHAWLRPLHGQHGQANQVRRLRASCATCNARSHRVWRVRRSMYNLEKHRDRDGIAARMATTLQAAPFGPKEVRTPVSYLKRVRLPLLWLRWLSTAHTSVGFVLFSIWSLALSSPITLSLPAT